MPSNKFSCKLKVVWWQQQRQFHPQSMPNLMYTTLYTSLNCGRLLLIQPCCSNGSSSSTIADYARISSTALTKAKEAAEATTTTTSEKNCLFDPRICGTVCDFAQSGSPGSLPSAVCNIYGSSAGKINAHHKSVENWRVLYGLQAHKPARPSACLLPSCFACLLSTRAAPKQRKSGKSLHPGTVSVG